MPNDSSLTVIGVFGALKRLSSRNACRAEAPVKTICGTPAQGPDSHCLTLLGAQPCRVDLSLQFSGDEGKRRQKEEPQTRRQPYCQLQPQLRRLPTMKKDLPALETADGIAIAVVPILIILSDWRDFLNHTRHFPHTFSAHHQWCHSHIASKLLRR